MDRLQERIRKRKNPSVLELAFSVSDLPPHLFPEGRPEGEGCARFCKELLETLKDTVPAVRFSFAAFALLPGGLEVLSEAMACARDMGYYVMLDAPDSFSPSGAERNALGLLGGTRFPCDGLVVSGYLGSDGIKPYLSICKQEEKDLFVVARTGNRSASELQDLLAGSRQVYLAAADHVNRYAGDLVGKSGYSQVAVMAAASSADSLRTIRAKYPKLFLLVDGYDYPNANAKNCAAAFDRFGHGAVVCSGSGITEAWKEAEGEGTEYCSCAKEAALRMKKNLTRYVKVL